MLLVLLVLVGCGDEFTEDEEKALKDLVKDKVVADAGSEKEIVWKKDGKEMVLIPAGSFEMGDSKNDPEEWMERSRPVHTVQLDAFYIDVHEVTVGQFREFVDQSGYEYEYGGSWDEIAQYSPGDEYPMIKVNWNDAVSYCKWAGKRLPTEAEWEYAARAGTTTKYYWGNEFETGKSNLCDSTCDMNISAKNVTDGFPFTAPVGSFPANPWGLHDMVGNVYEWTADWMDDKYYNQSPKDNPTGPVRTNPTDRKGGGIRKVIRGGAWASNTDSQRSAARKSFVVDYRIDSFGFRCVLQYAFEK